MDFFLTACLPCYCMFLTVRTEKSRGRHTSYLINKLLVFLYVCLLVSRLVLIALYKTPGMVAFDLHHDKYDLHFVGKYCRNEKWVFDNNRSLMLRISQLHYAYPKPVDSRKPHPYCKAENRRNWIEWISMLKRVSRSKIVCSPSANAPRILMCVDGGYPVFSMKYY